MARRHRGKRHKNVASDGSLVGGKGISSRNRNWAPCTHINYVSGKKCGELVTIRRGERALCREHRHRHTSLAKTKAIIAHCQRNKEDLL